jgi:uncharacterized membrane protein
VKPRNPLVAATLLAGVTISFVLLAVGFLQAIADPVPLIAETPTPYVALRGALSGEASATIMAGLLVLMLTPFARVIVLLYEFARAREGSFVAISIVVLCLLVTSIAISVS